jgi:hypothetical protein
MWVAHTRAEPLLVSRLIRQYLDSFVNAHHVSPDNTCDRSKQL